MKQLKWLLSIQNADYLELTYSCPDCHDTGFIGDKKCHCFKQAMVDLLYRQSNIHDVLKRENFDTFDIRYYSDTKNRSLGVSPRENIQAVLSTCHDFIDHFDEQSRNLLFYGDTGVGKTFLTNCIARELLDASHTVIYLTAFHLVDILQNNTFGNDDHYFTAFSLHQRTAAGKKIHHYFNESVPG